jgi:ketosteroid isomerase-like protein
MLGAWTSEAADSGETWVRVGEVLVGLGWSSREARTTAFEVMVIHRLDGPTYYTAMPGGTSQVDFTQTRVGTDAVEFGNPEHDHPKTIAYRYTETGLEARIEGDGGVQQFALRQSELVPAGTLDGEDRAFDADAAKRGGTAWAERFAPEGAMWPHGSDRIVGPALVKVAIDDMAAEGRVLRWEPVAGAMSPAGDLGFTTGRYRIMTDGKAVATGVYVSVWQRNAEGEWKIVFDTGV